jgi:tRNA threonylcarbamoyladenosine biosynthesis protein TsaB
MIDARRMEVFTMIYDKKMEVILAPQSLILNENSFSDQLQAHNVIFCGNGVAKWKEICRHPNAIFAGASHQIEDFAEVASRKFEQSQFADLAYAEPDYFKNFYTGR